MLDKAAKDRRYAIQDAVGKPGTRSNDAESRRDRAEDGLEPDRGARRATRGRLFQCRRGPGEAGRPCHAFVQTPREPLAASLT